MKGSAAVVFRKFKKILAWPRGEFGAPMQDFFEFSENGEG
jgi:hypothetical protein